MRLFGPSALDLIRAQRQGVEDYCKLRDRPNEYYHVLARFDGKLHIAWKCGWNQAEQLDRLRLQPPPLRAKQPTPPSEDISQHTRDFIAMARALGNIK